MDGGRSCLLRAVLLRHRPAGGLHQGGELPRLDTTTDTHMIHASTLDSQVYNEHFKYILGFKWSRLFLVLNVDLNCLLPKLGKTTFSLYSGDPRSLGAKEMVNGSRSS